MIYRIATHAPGHHDKKSNTIYSYKYTIFPLNPVAAWYMRGRVCVRVCNMHCGDDPLLHFVRHCRINCEYILILYAQLPPKVLNLVYIHAYTSIQLSINVRGIVAFMLFFSCQPALWDFRRYHYCWMCAFNSHCSLRWPAEASQLRHILVGWHSAFPKHESMTVGAQLIEYVWYIHGLIHTHFNPSCTLNFQLMNFERVPPSSLSE